MVSNEEIKRMLENRRRGIKTEEKKESPIPVPPTTGRKPMSPTNQTCESCGAQNPRDAKFCIKCGQTMQAPEKVEEKKIEAAPVDDLPRSGMDGIDYKTCPNCSHQNKPQAKFCVVCGHKLEDAPDSEPVTGSLLDRVPTETREDDQPAEEEVVAEDAPVVAELVDEESVQEETEKRSLLSRKVPEETLRQDTEEEIIEEEVVEEDYPEEVAAESVSEDVSAVENIPEEVSAVENIPEEVSAVENTEEAPISEINDEDEDMELPQVKTFQLGRSSVDTEENSVATEVEDEEVAEEPAEASEPVSTDVDPMEKIKKAKELLDIGAISEEEFEEIKKKYLALI